MFSYFWVGVGCFSKPFFCHWCQKELHTSFIFFPQTTTVSKEHTLDQNTISNIVYAWKLFRSWISQEGGMSLWGDEWKTSSTTSSPACWVFPTQVLLYSTLHSCLFLLDPPVAGGGRLHFEGNYLPISHQHAWSQNVKYPFLCELRANWWSFKMIKSSDRNRDFDQHTRLVFASFSAWESQQ